MSSEDSERRSGRDPITANLNVLNEETDPFTPISGRGFNVTVSGVFVGTIALLRKFAGDAAYYPCTDNGVPIAWTAPASEVVLEPEHGVEYKLKMTARTSGAADVRISQ